MKCHFEAIIKTIQISPTGQIGFPVYLWWKVSLPCGISLLSNAGSLHS
jgi:hypothetical protein